MKQLFFLFCLVLVFQWKPLTDEELRPLEKDTLIDWDSTAGCHRF